MVKFLFTYGKHHRPKKRFEKQHHPKEEGKSTDQRRVSAAPAPKGAEKDCTTQKVEENTMCSHLDGGRRRRERGEHHHTKESGAASRLSPREWWCFPHSSFGRCCSPAPHLGGGAPTVFSIRVVVPASICVVLLSLFWCGGEFLPLSFWVVVVCSSAWRCCRSFGSGTVFPLLLWEVVFLSSVLCSRLHLRGGAFPLAVVQRCPPPLLVRGCRGVLGRGGEGEEGAKKSTGHLDDVTEMDHIKYK